MNNFVNRLQSGRSGMGSNLMMKLFGMLDTHCSEDMRGASRQRGLAEAIMRNRSVQDRVVQR